MSGSPPEVSIIIVNTNDDATIRDCLHSIEIFEKNLSKEIIIVDNFSGNDLSSELSSAYPYISFIRLQENVGFSRANNIGIRKATGTFILLLNPDTFLTEPAISKCIRFLQSNPERKIGAVGCRLMNAQYVAQKSFFFSAASIFKTIQTNAFYIWLFRDNIKKKWEAQEEELQSSINEVPWLCGAFLLMRRDILLKENFFLDEDFFLYSDDVELGSRMRKKNYRLIYYPETAIVHLGSGGKNPWHTRYEQLVFSEWLCIMKIHGRFYFLSNQCFLLFNYCCDQSLFLKKALFRKSSFQELKSFLLRKKNMKLWYSYTFKILWY